MTAFALKPDRRRDPDGKHLRELLQAIVEVDRYGALRSLAFHALAVLGVILWVANVFPADLPDRVRRIALALFAAIAVGGVVAWVLEARWQRIQRRCMSKNDVQSLDDDHGEA
jgi:hypothetical protein